MGFGIQSIALAVVAANIGVVFFAIAMAVYGVDWFGRRGQQHAGCSPRTNRACRCSVVSMPAGIDGAILTSAVHTSGGFAVGTLLIAAGAVATRNDLGGRCFRVRGLRRRLCGGQREHVNLQDGLETSESVAPLGYEAYFAVVLVSRMAADPLVKRLGGGVTASIGIVSAAIGCLLVIAVPTAARRGDRFRRRGLGRGIGRAGGFRAGESCPPRRDEVMERVNRFSYGGALIGAVVLGRCRRIRRRSRSASFRRRWPWGDPAVEEFAVDVVHGAE